MLTGWLSVGIIYGKTASQNTDAFYIRNGCCRCFNSNSAFIFYQINKYNHRLKVFYKVYCK